MTDDLISRQGAIDAFTCKGSIFTYGANECKTIISRIMTLPSAQPEIIYCKDCKYRDENWRRVSVKWLPCMDVQTGDNWYCGSAERGE